jgi:hypothetical protein
MIRTRRSVWLVAPFCVVLAAALAPRIGIGLLAPLASLLVGAAASAWLGNAAGETAAHASRASAIAGLGALLATIVALPIVTLGVPSHFLTLGPYGTLLVGIGLGLINLGLSVLGGTLAWLAVGEPTMPPIGDQP